MIKKYKIQGLLFILFGLLYFYILFNLYSTMPINSDFASFILESEEIKNGNIFLKDWNFTGIIFLFTDLLYFLIGSLFFEVSVNSYILGITLMYFVYLIITIKFILGKDKNINFKRILLLFALCLFPNQFALDILRTHLPIYTLFLISLFNYEKYLLSNKKRYLKILFITFIENINLGTEYIKIYLANIGDIIIIENIN